MKVRIATALVALGASAGTASASIVNVYDDPGLFASLSGPVTSIDFVAPPGGPGLIDQDTYIGQGLILGTNLPGHPAYSVTTAGGGPLTQDGWGLDVFLYEPPFALAFDFTAPTHSFAYERFFLGGVEAMCKFYLQGVLVGSNTLSTFPGTDDFHFVGWVADFQFDRVVTNTYWVDNVYFASVPAPGAILLLPAGFLLARGRRRPTGRPC